MFPEPFDFNKQIKKMVESILRGTKVGVSVWKVTDIQSKTADGYYTEYKCQIKELNFKYTLDNVPIAGIGLGNNKGIYKYPAIGDFVVVAFNDAQPIILGTIPDYFTQKPDNTPLIKDNEMIIIPKENGSLILFQQNNDLIIRTADVSGNLSNGCKIKLKGDGSFKIYNKGNYGIDVDASGNMMLRGVTIDHTQTAGVF